jgi:RNA recognition motif-containing protein
MSAQKPHPPPPPVETDVLRKLYVGNLRVSVTEADVFQLFRQCGPISDLVVLKDDKGINRRVGFVHFETVDCARRAISDINDRLFQGLRLQVKTALPRHTNQRRWPGEDPQVLDAKFGWPGSPGANAAEPPPSKPSAPVLDRDDRRRKFDYPVYPGPVLTGGQSGP